jgi:drug/metabolite transporter (DMT)-like permease
MIGSIICLISYLSVALMGVCVKLIPHSVGMGKIIFFQYAIALILCLPITFKNGLSSVKTKNIRGHVFRDISGIITFGLFFLSLLYISLTNAIVLRSTTPFWIPLILFVWRGDRISKALWISIFIGFIGVILIIKPAISGYLNLGTLYALLSGFFMGISALAIRRLSASEPAQRTLFYYCLIATIVSAPFALSDWQSMSKVIWLLLIAIGILMYIVQYTLIKAFQFAKASVLAPMSYSAIVFSGLFDWGIWGKTPDLYEYIGIFIIILSGIVTIILERKNESRGH